MVRERDYAGKEGRDAFLRKVRAANAVVFFFCGALSSILLAPFVKRWLLILREPVVWAPDPPPFMPLLFCVLSLSVALFVGLGALFSGQPSPRWASVIVIVVTCVVVFWSAIPKGSDSLEMTPGLQVGLAVDALVTGVAEVFHEEGEYPAEDERLELMLAGRDSGFRTRRGAVSFSVVTEVGLGPRLRAREGDLPGTFYYTVAPDRRRYWVTALVLDDVPTGRLVFAQGDEGPLVVSRGPADVRSMF